MAATRDLPLFKIRSVPYHNTSKYSSSSKPSSSSNRLLSSSLPETLGQWDVASPDYPHHWTAATTPADLTIPVHLTIPPHTYVISALVDTGCSVPLLLREGIIPPHLLTPATHPIQLGTASGDPMAGGQQGINGDLVLGSPCGTKKSA